MFKRQGKWVTSPLAATPDCCKNEGGLEKSHPSRAKDEYDHIVCIILQSSTVSQSSSAIEIRTHDILQLGQTELRLLTADFKHLQRICFSTLLGILRSSPPFSWRHDGVVHYLPMLPLNFDCVTVIVVHITCARAVRMEQGQPCGTTEETSSTSDDAIRRI